MKNLYLFSTLLLCSILIGCDPNDSNSTPSPSADSFSDNFGSSVSRDFIGQIVNQDNNPIQNATVQIGTASVQSDSNGVFIINDASVYEKFAYITAKKTGFIDGSRSMVPTNGKNNVRIMLISAEPVATIASGASAEVALPSGTKVVFDGAFEDENGNAYSGNVSVSMFHLETSNPNLHSLMPGMLYAKTETGDEAALQTFGMLNVELRGSAGQKLQIAGGHTADIEILIDPSQIASAPQTISLSHFDEANGYWKQQGSAVKVGSKYVGQVSHFSWWDFDMLNSSLLITFNIVDTSGNAMPNALIGISGFNGGIAGGITDENGHLSGMLPADTSFNVNAFSPTCSIWPAPTTIGPFTSDTVVPNLVVEDTNTFTTVTGNLVNCDNNVTNGYVLIWYESTTQIIAVTNGTFNAAILLCDANSEISVLGFDIDNTLSTGQTTIAAGFPETNFGNISACNVQPVLNLAGEYTVVVTQNDNSQTHTFPNEIITQTSNYQYHTSSTGLYLPGELAPSDYGFDFITDGYEIIVPSQNLADYYTNQVTGNSQITDGTIIDESHFTINYSIWFAGNTVERTFTAVYTRN